MEHYQFDVLDWIFIVEFFRSVNLGPHMVFDVNYWTADPTELEGRRKHSVPYEV